VNALRDIDPNISVLTSSSVPRAFVAVNVTVYAPAAVYV
jgi:hypothetical protein